MRYEGKPLLLATDGRTDGQTKRAIEELTTLLKRWSHESYGSLLHYGNLGNQER